MTDERIEPPSQESREEALREAERILRGAPTPDQLAKAIESLERETREVEKLISDGFKTLVDLLDSTSRTVQVIRDSLHLLQTSEHLLGQAILLKLIVDRAKKQPEQGTN